MSISISASGQYTSHKHRRASRKAFPNHVFVSAAIGCAVLGCAWILHANVFGASIYPTMAAGNFDAAVIKQPSVVAAARPAPVTTRFLDAFPEPPPVISPPLTVASVARLDFNDRFGAAAPQSVEPTPQVEAPKLASVSAPVDVRKPADAPKLALVSLETPKPKAIAPQPAGSKVVASVAPAPDIADAKPAKGTGASVKDMAQRAKAAVMSIASGGRPSMVDRLWGKEPSHGSLLSYASADVSATGSLPREQNPMLGGSAPYDRSTAVYDISARKVYLPDGTVLEAHSGLGSKLDDVRFAHVRMQGVTPPHIYELKPREALFHGVPALRLTPVGGEDKIFGRSGLLAHTYMLGPNGDSNGCVSFKDYYAFLDAYRNRGIKRLAVVARVE